MLSAMLSEKTRLCERTNDHYLWIVSEGRGTDIASSEFKKKNENKTEENMLILHPMYFKRSKHSMN